eukprot:SAG22_NODE_9049_length_613_cov_0.698444_1_plen_67_part_00
MADKDEEQRVAAQLEDCTAANAALWSELDELMASFLVVVLDTAEQTGWKVDNDDMRYLLGQSTGRS